MTGMFKNRVALAVPDYVRFLFANRQGSGRPDSARVFVAQVNDFAGRIANSVVGPWRQTILVAVYRPGIAGAGFCNLKTKVILVGNNVGPGSRSPLFRSQQRHVFAPSLMKSAQAIEEG